MVVRLAAHAMGTRFEIVLDGDDPHRLRPIGEAALHEIEDWHDRLSRFDPGSFVSHINARAAREPVALDDDLFDLLGGHFLGAGSCRGGSLGSLRLARFSIVAP